MSSPPKHPNERKVDPGWNDPPMLNYSSANPPPKSRITNKRVAFPMSSTVPTTSHSTSESAAAVGDLSDKTFTNLKSPPKN